MNGHKKHEAHKEHKEAEEKKDPKDREISDLKKELEKKEQAINDYINQIKRTQADFENYRKRIEKEQDQSSQREVEKLAGNMLCIIDNLERALDASKKNHDLEALTKGIDMTHKNLIDILTKVGLKPIECIGNEFDPHMHEAIMTIESKDHKDNTVYEELEKGYVLKNKVIRPAKVKVVKNE
ncbi:MAG: nucleotide exchange factor GrpE [archaeon]